MWFCVKCEERNNEEGSGECMVCGSAEPAAPAAGRASARMQKKVKTAAAVAAAAPPLLVGAAWRKHDTLLVYGEAPRKEAGKTAAKVAAFDLDSTLVVPKSGAKFARSGSDWQWLDKRVPEKLRELRMRGYHLLVFSNQGGVEKGQTTEADVRGAIVRFSPTFFENNQIRSRGANRCGAGARCADYGFSGLRERPVSQALARHVGSLRRGILRRL
jgi:hypothetical protein